MGIQNTPHPQNTKNLRKNSDNVSVNLLDPLRDAELICWVCIVDNVWVPDPILIRKTKSGVDKNLLIRLIGGEGWNCIGDDAGRLFREEGLCTEYCAYRCVCFIKPPSGM